MVDNNVTMVQASYTDVNNALEGLIGNITQGSGDTSNFASKTDLTNAQASLNTEIVNLQNTINNAGYATETELNKLADSVPVGTIFGYSSNNIPSGYMLCNGASFDQTKLSDLYSALGTSAVPDTRGLFLRGLDTTGSVDIDGATRGLLSYQEGSMLPIEHFQDNMTGAANYGQGNSTRENLGYEYAANPNKVFDIASITNAANQYGVGSTNYGIARPKNIAVNYIIKAFKLATYGTASNALTTNGGTLVGQLTGNKGGIVPQVVGMSGNVVIQNFVASVPLGVPRGTITFPTPFAADTVPVVMCGVVTEEGTEIVSTSAVKQNSDGSLQITNTGFNYYKTTGTYESDRSASIPVLAIGIM